MITKINKCNFYNEKVTSKYSLALFLCFLAFVLTIASAAEKIAADEKPIWLVVTRPVFTETIKPLQEKRNKDGFETVISTQSVAEAIAALKRQPAFLLLVGDEQPGQEKQPWYLPSKKCKFYRWRASQEEYFASDTFWGDINGDLVPDIPTGRIPARTTEQLKLVIDKIIAFEDRPPTLDDLRMPIWAGASGYNQMLDSMTTLLLLGAIEKYTSPWLSPWIISSDPKHSLCGWPPDQAATFVKQLKQGCGPIVTMMGHSAITYFYSMSFNNTGILFSAADAEKPFAAGKPAPPLVIISCSTGNFTSEQECLTKSLLFMPAGPVAAIGAATESHPLTNYFSGLCLLQQVGFKEKQLGKIWLEAQLRAMKTHDIFMEPLLINVEGKLEEKMNESTLRRDQILMYTLLGDPATKLHLPDKLEATVKRIDNGWQWEAQKPKGTLKLFAGFRPAGQNFPLVIGNPDKTTATKLFEQANAIFEFTPIDEINANQAWKGQINKEGILRLVAVGQNCFYVSTFELKAKTEN